MTLTDFADLASVGADDRAIGEHRYFLDQLIIEQALNEAKIDVFHFAMLLSKENELQHRRRVSNTRRNRQKSQQKSEKVQRQLIS